MKEQFRIYQSVHSICCFNQLLNMTLKVYVFFLVVENQHYTWNNPRVYTVIQQQLVVEFMLVVAVLLVVL